MNNMLLRAISGSIYVILIALCTMGGVMYFAALMALLSVLGILELEKLLGARATVSTGARVWDCFTAVAIISAITFMAYSPLTGFTKFGFGDIALVLFGMSILYIPVRMMLAVLDRGENQARSAMYSLFSLGYVLIPLVLLTISYCISGSRATLAMFIFIWLNDTGAYLSGRTWGRNKLCERLSPKKTREGFYGGFALTVIAGMAAAYIIGGGTATAYITWGIYSAAVSVLATFGDLFESLLKRTLGVKDSGKLIPGHGGILDRIDSLLAVAPLALLMTLATIFIHVH